jgi:DNA-binding NarL/FixJ family response regulator
MNPEPLRVFLVDDHPVVRSGWRADLEGFAEVVGEADHAGPAIDMILERSPDVVLLDVQFEGGGGERVAREVTRADPDIRLLAVSASGARVDVVRVMAAGATGYITKTAGAEELRGSIQRVSEGRAVFSADLAGIVVDLSGDPELLDPDVAALTERELEVLRLIALGLTYREVSDRLFISVKTIESHMSRILSKLRLTNRHALARWAHERGLA